MTIARASWIGTAALVVTSAGAILTETARGVAVIADLLMFAGGTAAFLWAYAIAVGRSRTDEIGIGGLYFLQGSAPKSVKWHLLGSLAAQVTTAVVAAALKPFTGVAFAVLAPMWGLGLAGLWAAKYGSFPARTDRVP